MTQVHFRFLYLSVALAMIFGPFGAHADLISPVNHNTAYRLVLAADANAYAEFVVRDSKGQVLPIGQPIHVDVDLQCVNLTIELSPAARKQFGQRLRFDEAKICDQFVKGTTTDILIYGLQLSGRALAPDAVHGNPSFNVQMLVGQDSRFELTSDVLTGIDHVGLLPVFLQKGRSLRSRIVNLETDLKADEASGTLSYQLPVETLRTMVLKRKSTSYFPTSSAMEFVLKRGSSLSSAAKRIAMPSGDLALTFLKLPWIHPKNDYLNIEISHSPLIQFGYYLMGTTPPGRSSLPTPTVTYPDEIGIHRIDVDDVKVFDHTGASKMVKGRFTVLRESSVYSPGSGLASTGYHSLFTNLPTQTGVDVFPGNYKVLVDYQDPFTNKTEQQIHYLDLK